MQAYSSDPLWREYNDLEETARSAYRMADAMLAARNA